jgi:mono/diheme cytochrome c family protein
MKNFIARQKTSGIALMTVLIIAACSSAKKSSSSTTSTAPAPTTPTAATLPAKPANGIYAPGNEELVAIQEQYKEVTLDQLKEGYFLYAKGACVNCHGAKNIYLFGEAHWNTIIEDMAPKARISDAQKDAVYKYVLSIKATQPR